MGIGRTKTNDLFADQNNPYDDYNRKQAKKLRNGVPNQLPKLIKGEPSVEKLLKGCSIYKVYTKTRILEFMINKNKRIIRTSVNMEEWLGRNISKLQEWAGLNDFKIHKQIDMEA